MAKLVSREDAMLKVTKSGMLLRLCNGHAMAKEFDKGKIIQTVPIRDFCVALVSPSGEISCFDNREVVHVMYSAKYKVCWVECLKPVNEDTVAASSDGIVYEPTLINGKVIIMWAEEATDNEEDESVLKHYLTADISSEGIKFAHVEEMLYTKELLDTLMSLMAQMKKKEELDLSKGAFRYISEMAAE